VGGVIIKAGRAGRRPDDGGDAYEVATRTGTEHRAGGITKGRVPLMQ
jgi:hypothetical protein